MFGRLGELPIGEIKFDKWIDFGHKDTIYKLKFGWLKFGKSWTTRQIYQTFPLYVSMWVTVCSYVTCNTNNYCYNHHYATLDPVHIKYYSSTFSVPLC